MKHATFWLAMLFAASMSAALVSADDPPADGTVIVLDPEQSPDDLTLPETASNSAREHAAFGLGTANQARDQARDLGSELGQQVSEARQGIRADLERNERADLRGDNASAQRH